MKTGLSPLYDIEMLIKCCVFFFLIPSVGMSVLWGWFKRKQVGPSFRRQNY